MAILVDWVKQQTATTGTGTITLGSAVSGFIRFQDDTRLTDGTQVYYTIEDGTSRERGIGTYTASGTTLSRDVIHATLVSGTYTENPGSGLNLSGSAVVSCSAIANTHNFRGALLFNSTNETSTTASNLILSFDSETYDVGGFHEGITNPTRLTIPEGVKYVIFRVGVRWDNSSAGIRVVDLLKNGASDFRGGFRTIKNAANDSTICAVSSVLSVTQGDYFEIQSYQNSGGSLDVLHTDSNTYFSVEVIE